MEEEKDKKKKKLTSLLHVFVLPLVKLSHGVRPHAKRPEVLLLELGHHLDNVVRLGLDVDEDRPVSDWTIRAESHEVIGKVVDRNAKIRPRFIY